MKRICHGMKIIGDRMVFIGGFFVFIYSRMIFIFEEMIFIGGLIHFISSKIFLKPPMVSSVLSTFLLKKSRFTTLLCKSGKRCTESGSFSGAYGVWSLSVGMVGGVFSLKTVAGVISFSF
jgi:hypothetical protein